ncbi:lipopolysaccharide kinase InaA family protein [Pseudomonas sp. NCCP-436]|uniref:lipopolysaccharide kinase InaA family protein n=1 Tax=Pseudomonas sp. NCCP-436 TaxID=2842481 RepID=UPI001C80462A|nr:lipopolysaccharide kinase InaA family protein [Pseudomonas sp. NCCP-436]GIZ10992.1 hypothetical protein NCCP436_04080 [Pseudomonas sp. NCCP-436]
MTLGLPRRQGIFDWGLAEVINSIEAYRRGVPTAPLKGFGCRRRGRGLVSEVFIVSQWLEGHVDGVEWLRQPGVDVEEFVLGAFDLIRVMHEKEVHHLDLWAANIMVDPHGGTYRAIDLENCYLGKTDFLAETLGFQFGFLYFRGLHSLLDEAHYDALVEQALSAYADIDRKRFQVVYQPCKHRHVGRKERGCIPQYGILPSD